MVGLLCFLGKVLTKHNNLDVFGTDQNTPHVGEANLPDGVFTLLERSTTKAMLELLSVERLQRQIFCSAIRYTQVYLSGLMKYRTWLPNPGDGTKSTLSVCFRFLFLNFLVVLTELSWCVDHYFGVGRSSDSEECGRQDIRRMFRRRCMI